MITFFLEGRLDGLNSVVDANRRNRYAGAKLKAEATNSIAWQIKTFSLPHLTDPHHYTFTWHEKDKRRDPDNVASACKFIFDGLIAAGVIDNDGWGQVAGITHKFVVDPWETGVEVGVS